MIRLRIVLALACLLLPGCLATAPAAEAATRRALLVGIDDYDAAHAPSCPEPPAGEKKCRCEWRDLEGAVNDAHAMRDLLIAQYGFRPQDIKLLIDREATRDKILAAIRSQLIMPALPGDEVFFFYAGHGSQIHNSLSDEPDKLDETLVPADARRGAADIRDKELRRLFDEILERKARLTVILDSCHSGSAGRGYPPAGRIRRLPQDCRDIADSPPTGLPPEQRGALILSAAQDDQLALESWDETTKAHHGAFTLALLEAMGREGPQAPAGEIFLRAKASMQTRGAAQEPVLAGARQSEPLFGSGAIRSSRDAVRTRGEAVAAVTQVDSAGIVYLQDGWASGLGEGSELEELAPAKNSSPLRLRVTAVQGPVRSEARILGAARAGNAFPKTGDLYRLVRWVVTSKPALRVWVPETGERWETLRDLAVAFRDAVRTAGHFWVTDPVAETPSHVLSWEHGTWKLRDPAGRITDLGATPAPAALVHALSWDKQPARLFVHLPATQDLAKAIHLGRGTDNDAVEKSAGPEDAHYYLVGRLNGETPELAWVHPAMGIGSSAPTSLPPRTDWFPWPPAGGAAKDGSAALGGTLEDAALHLAKIQAWLTLDSPPGDGFPYRLALLDSEKRKVAPESPLPAGATYGLALEAQPQGKPVIPRYAYVFAINSSGASILLFPPASRGSVENRFPPSEDGHPPAQIPLGEQPSFRIVEPFGTDTYFLLTTEEAVPDPWVLQYPGVRRRGPQGKTPLEELLSQRGSSRRGQEPILPVTWSIEKLTFESTPPRPAP
jgi:hypothetical protein